MSFFASRWVEPLGHVAEDPAVGLLPKGFRAAGVACGIKPNGDRDLGVLISGPEATTSAARFTRSSTRAAPVIATSDHARTGALRGIVVNSGNANAATGEPGLRDATEMQAQAARETGLGPDGQAAVAVASTGVIGVPLPMSAVRRGIAAAAAELRADGGEDFSAAIRTTDAYPKHVAVTVTLPGGTVRLTAQAKGAGMISPGFATMLCFIQTDARLSAATADLLLTVTTRRSFERISVDGQMSTSDMVILQCSGESGVAIEPETEDELRFGEALDIVLRQLALLIVRDGEGARRVGRVLVRGGDEDRCAVVARTIADSALVKTALHGGDPNWGRIVQAAGMALPSGVPLELDIAIEGVRVCSRGAYVPHDHAALAAAVAGEEVEYEVTLPGEGAQAEMFFSDLGHEYITINADYTT